MKKPKPDTLLVTAGRDPKANHGIINPPVYRASTVLFPTVAELHESQKRRDPKRTRYGRHGTPTTFALEEAIAALEGGHHSIAVGSGVAAITANVMTAIDNTWATPLYYKPLAHGVDVSILSATKYIAGHSDLMMGLITTTEAAYLPVRRAVEDFGGTVGPDDCYLALRGYR